MSERPRVRLGDVLRQASEPHRVDATAEYPNFGIYSFGRGLFHKLAISGATSSATTLYRVKAGQFIYSRLFAFEGAYGLVKATFDGHFVSNEYPTFDADSARLMPEYLLAFLRLPRTWEEIAKRSKGMGDRRRRVQPEQFLTHKIPLPPLEEQRRLVTRIEELAAHIIKATALHLQALEDGEALLVSMAHRLDLSDDEKRRQGWQFGPLSDVVRFVDDSHPVVVSESYPNLGMYSFGRGLFLKPPIDGSTSSAATLRRVKKGQFIYSRLFAFEGAYGMVTDEFDGHWVSNEYPTFECDPRRVRAEFLAAYFRPQAIWRAAAIGSKGLGDRRQRVQPSQILNLSVWVPPIEWQVTLAAVWKEVDALKRLQAEIAAELDALLPAILDRAFKGEL